MTAWDERKFIEFAAAPASLLYLVGNLGVIDLHVQREGDLWSLKKRDVAVSGNRHKQGCRLMRLEAILADFS